MIIKRENPWHNQKDCPPEQFEHLIHREENADEPRHYTVVHPNGDITEHFDTVGKLEYTTDHVLVFYGYHKDTKEPLFCIDRRRKFNNKEEWLWCKMEGCEDWDDLMWMEIPKGFDLNKLENND